MYKPINANSLSVGEIFSHSAFLVPQYQREYSWQKDEVSEFWKDLHSALLTSEYFLGLMILTDEDGADRQFVVDGQQRIVTISLLATALYFEAIKRERKALADKIKADFLTKINFDTDETDARVILSDHEDNETLQYIFRTGDVPKLKSDEDSVSKRIIESYTLLRASLQSDLKSDPFKRLGKWAEFLSSKIFMAVFVHPDAATAYQVFEVINQRGRDLTTADLLKNYILSDTDLPKRDEVYTRWQALSKRFPPEGSNNTFVQFIRHTVTVDCGHILPKDLYKFLAARQAYGDKEPPSTPKLLSLLESNISLYSQMIDPTISGPANDEELKVFSALNSLGVISVRPILIALHNSNHTTEGVKILLQLVVKRIVSGSLGTGNVERLFSEAAKDIKEKNSLTPLVDGLAELYPPMEDFKSRLLRKTFTKGVATFIRKSISEKSCTPESNSTLHYVRPPNGSNWAGMGEEDAAFWTGTIGNTVLADLNRRPQEASDSLARFKEFMLDHIEGDISKIKLEETSEWTAIVVESLGQELAKTGAEVWY